MVVAPAPDEVRARITRRLGRQFDGMVTAVSSLLASEFDWYRNLGPDTFGSTARTDAGELLAVMVRAVADRDQPTPAELAALRLKGASWARQGLAPELVGQIVEVCMAMCWLPIGEELADSGDPGVVSALDAELALRLFSVARSVEGALLAGHGSERGHGVAEDRNSRATDVVARVLDGSWDDEEEIDGGGRVLGVDVRGPWLLLLVTHRDGRKEELQAAATALRSVGPGTFLGRIRRRPSWHLPMLVRAGDADPWEDFVEAVDELASARGLVVLRSDPVPTWEALAPVYRRETSAIACVRAAGHDRGVVGRRETAVYRLLQAVPVEARVDFVRDVLGPEPEPGRKALESLATLETYVGMALNSERAAAVAGMHRNSFRYRLTRAATALGVDLQSGPDLIRVHLALAVRRLTREELAWLEGGAQATEGHES